MGIPTFYKWAHSMCPSASYDAEEEFRYPVDTSGPNPNGVEFDNLYLDLNGIIHPCFHPDGHLAFETYEEVFTAIYSYIDRIFSIVRPRKLLFLAIDGVAPRAKLNHQRSRRFRSAKDAADQAPSDEGNKVTPDLKQKMDSNIITPGTEFMVLLSSALKYYIHLKMNQSITTDAGWRNIKVILSDASVPGEGEHKIMSYIRLQRNLPGYDPNTHHCLYGLDADLILLALASHEIHFTILRELAAKGSRKELKNTLRKLKGASERMEAVRMHLETVIQNQIFTFLKVWVLRQSIVKAMTNGNLRLKLDEERLIDDFVLMCMFVGNDFLPRLPSLQVSKGSVSHLMKTYSKEFNQIGGYLTNSFEVNLERVEHFIKLVSLESETPKTTGKKSKKTENSLEQQASKKNTQEVCCSPVKSETSSISQDQIDGNDGSEVQMIVDTIRLGEEGWKERYYAEKFEAKTEDDRDQLRKHVVSKYIEGVCWIMRYYYEGVCSWQWFYPYYHAPPASDFNGISQLEIHFTLGEPFKPFEQLMAVMPPESAHAVPACYRKLMTDLSSPILDFYPTDYEVDMNGSDVQWMAICKIPFIEEQRLLSELSKLENSLTCEEAQRNVFGINSLFLHISHPLAREIFSFYQKESNYSELLQTNFEIDPKYSGGMNGFICLHNKITLQSTIHSPIPWLDPVEDNQVISVLYKHPKFHPHIPRPPNGVILPQMKVGRQAVTWRKFPGDSFRNRVTHDKKWRALKTITKKISKNRNNNQNRGQFRNRVIAGNSGAKKMAKQNDNVMVPRIWRE